MNEDEYLSIMQPQVLLERTARWGKACFRCTRRLHGPSPSCPSCGGARHCPAPPEQKVRLIACACLRFLRDELGAELPLADLEAAERFSEGRTSTLDVSPGSPVAMVLLGLTPRMAAITAIRTVMTRSLAVQPGRVAAKSVERVMPALQQASLAAERGGADAVRQACRAVERSFRQRDAKLVDRLVRRDRRRLCDAIRDVLGNPYRPPAVKPAWLDANRKLARTIAAEIDETGRFADVPILGDALEEAGCTDATVLQHARKPRHYRGCWLIAAIVSRS